MKFMKLGSTPDAFQSDGNNIRYVSSDLVTDCTVIVDDVKFNLHKFPLLSKSKYMHKLLQKADEDTYEEIRIVDFPGGARAFEICAKFCYGMAVTLNAYNVVATRCAAEYLQMTEDVDQGNLIFKVEVFLNSGIFRSWKDSIIVLQTTKSFMPWSEDLKIVGRCVDSIASKTSVDPTNIRWSYTHNRKLEDKIVEHGMKFQDKMESVPKDWWVEDICELEINQYKQVMLAVKSKEKFDENVIGEALKTYAVRWLPYSVDALVSDAHTERNQYQSVVETIIWLLPSENGVGWSCTFLLKLLKVAILIEANDLVRGNLVELISLKLHEASVNDLLIPARPPQMTKYDVELVQCILKRFEVHEKGSRSSDVNENENDHGSLLIVGELVDRYLAEIAKDSNLTVSSFVDLSLMIPESARPMHNRLYKAIDVYLKEHPSLTKAERKRICGLMDVKKLTSDASMHAAQNERLPLRVVVQVLFFEQVRAAAKAQALSTSRNSTNTEEEEWEVNEKVKEEEKGKKLATKSGKSSRSSSAELLPSRSRRIFDKLWGVGKDRSSETSGSSQSPTSQVPGEAKAARNRRHSIS